MRRHRPTPSPPDRPPRSRRRLGVLCGLLVIVAALYAFLWRASPDMRRITIAHARSALGLPPALGPRVVRRDGRRLITGAPKDAPPAAFFDVTDTRIDPRQLRAGLGREYFSALITPRFVTTEEAEREGLDLDTRVLALRLDDETRVYPLPYLRHHEVVNDVVAGRPVFAAYCILADLGALYDRRIDDTVFTFAVSGYLYHEPGVWDGAYAFVLWDRDTESLWWPPIGRSVSGTMIDTPLDIVEREHWQQTTWGAVRDTLARSNGQRVQVLARRQAHVIPDSWPTHHRKSGARAFGSGSAAAPDIAPRWGDNPELHAPPSTRHHSD